MLSGVWKWRTGVWDVCTLCLTCSVQTSWNVMKVNRLLNCGGGESKCEWPSVNVPVIYDSYRYVSFCPSPLFLHLCREKGLCVVKGYCTFRIINQPDSVAKLRPF